MDLLPPGSSQSSSKDSESGAYLRHVCWTPPPDDAWKLNISGFISNHLSGIGGAAFVIRDHNAVFKHAGATPVFDVKGVLLPELLALALGLETAVHLGVDFLEVEGACGALFDLLADGDPPVSGALREPLDCCVELMNSFRTLTLHCVNAFNNVAAGRLAEFVVWDGKPRCWPTKPPNAIAGILQDDVIGVYVRIEKP